MDRENFELYLHVDDLILLSEFERRHIRVDNYLRYYHSKSMSR